MMRPEDKYIGTEVDVSDWDDCKPWCKIEDGWEAKWRVSPDEKAYLISAERDFPGRGTWHQDVVVLASFLANAQRPGLALAGLLHSLVPEPRRPGHIHIHEN